MSPIPADRRAPQPLASWRSPIVWLAFAITAGFFAALFFIMLKTETSPDMMLGALMAAFSGIVGYYFGSSNTSAGKDAAISDLTKTAAAVASTAQASQVAADVAAAAGAAPLKAGEVQIDAQSVTVDSRKGTP